MLKAEPPRDGGSHSLFCAGTTHVAPHLYIAASSGNPAKETGAFETSAGLQRPNGPLNASKAHPDLEDPYALLLPGNS